MTRIEFYEWLDTCPTNWNKDGSRVQNNGPTPNFWIIDDGCGTSTIRFVFDEKIIIREKK